jgi:hypothetical protein
MVPDARRRLETTRFETAGSSLPARDRRFETTRFETTRLETTRFETTRFETTRFETTGLRSPAPVCELGFAVQARGRGDGQQLELPPGHEAAATVSSWDYHLGTSSRRGVPV